MRTIKAEAIQQAVSGLCVKANISLRPDMLKALRGALKSETHARAKKMLSAIIDNAAAARRGKLAVCQDTGVPVVFVEIGDGVHIAGDMRRAIDRGIEHGYKLAHLRNSIIRTPLSRGASVYSPGVYHFMPVPGKRVKITVLPKGFGSENKSQLKMFNPTAGIDEIKQFIVSAVKSAGPNACPPFVVGVGIGGTADYACLLAKKALLRKISTSYVPHPTSHTVLEKSLLTEINASNIGPMGLGGKTTALAVHIETYPTHIAGMPVAVNISCHALRSASVAL